MGVPSMPSPNQEAPGFLSRVDPAPVITWLTPSLPQRCEQAPPLFGVARSDSVQKVDGRKASGGRFYFAFLDDLLGAVFLAIDVLIGIAIGAHRGAFEGDAGENTAGTGVR